MSQTMPLSSSDAHGSAAIPASLASYLAERAHASASLKLLYVGIPGAASRSIAAWISSLDDAHGTHAITGDRLVEALGAEGLFVFSVVRHPVARMFSVWQSTLTMPDFADVTLQSWAAPKELGFACAQDIALAFEDFVERMAASEPGSLRDATWTPQIDLIRPDVVGYSQTFQLERPLGLRHALSRHAGRDVGDPLGQTPHLQDLLRCSASLVTRRASDLIWERYRLDYEAFGYRRHELADAELPQPEMCIMFSQACERIRAERRHLVATERRTTEIQLRLYECQDSLARANERVQALQHAESQQISLLAHELGVRDRTVQEILHSSSWRLTAPIRALMSFMRKHPGTTPGAAPSQGDDKARPAAQTPHIADVPADLPTDAPVARIASMPAHTPAPKPRVLIVEHRIPTPDITSGSTRLQAIIDWIVARGWDATMASHVDRPEYRWVMARPDVELLRYERRLSDAGIRLLFGRPAIEEHLKADGRAYDLVILSYPEVMHQYAEAVRLHAPMAFLAYDTVDLHGLRFRREAISKGMDAELFRMADRYDSIESANIDSADVTIAVTGNEAEEIRRRSPHAQVSVVSNIHAARATRAPREGRRGMMFIGHYLHAPNADAMTYFVSEVLPRIQSRIGDEPLFMLGSSMTDEIRALARPGVEPIGWVLDPEPWFDRCRVFVAPLRFGAGMKGKIGQAMSLGLPVVTTPIGAEGMLIERGVHAIVEEDAEAFADAVARVYRDDQLWDSLSAQGLAHIDRHFSPAAVGAGIDRILQAALGRKHA